MQASKIVTHPSVQASAVAGGIFGSIEVLVTDIPWSLWAVWAVLTITAVVQAARAAGATR